MLLCYCAPKIGNLFTLKENFANEKQKTDAERRFFFVKYRCVLVKRGKV